MKVKESYKLTNFVWVVFIKKFMVNIIPIQLYSIQFKNGTHFPSQLTIPYDCEFVAIRPHNGTTYKLTEMYRIKSKFFSLDYGVWDEVRGLKVQNLGFYRRRSNFQKIEMRLISITSLPVRTKIQIVLPMGCP